MLNVDLLRERYAKGSSVKEELAHLYQKIEEDQKREDSVNAYNFLTKKLATKASESPKEGPLKGVFVAVKDNIHVKGERTTCGSAILENYEAIYDSTVVSLLKEAGAIIVGKANMDEFAMGASNTTSIFGDVRNPHDRTKIAGGSSGGSAAAVAAGFATMALGTDTGGSVRVPAAYCGVVGLKPTYGAISRYGVMSMAPILDQVGPIASNVQDCALLYSILANYDENDLNSISMPFLDSTTMNQISPKKIGIVKEFSSIFFQEEILNQFQKLKMELEKMGHQVVEISLPRATHSIETYFIISRVQGFSSLSMMDGVRYGRRAKSHNLDELYKASRGEGFHQEVSKRILMGHYILSKTDLYTRARKMQTILFQDLKKSFETVDLILCPTVPEVAPSLDSQGLFSVEGCSVDMLTSLSNLTGTPALSVPYGKNSQGLPIGFQIMGPLCSEGDLFALGLSIQSLGQAS